MKLFFAITGSLTLIVSLLFGRSAFLRGRDSDDSAGKSVAQATGTRSAAPATIPSSPSQSKAGGSRSLDESAPIEAIGKSGEKATVVLPAVVVAADRTPVRAGLAGILKKLTVAEGNAVESCQVVAELETVEIDAELERQTAAIAAAKKLVEECESQLAFAEYERGSYQDLAKDKAIGPLEVEGSKSRARSTTAKLAALRSQIVVEERRQAALQRKREKHQFLAPFAGTVTETLRYANQYVGEGDLVLWIESHDKRLKLHVPATLVASLDQLRFSWFYKGEWLDLTVHAMKPNYNPDGSRTVLLRLPHDDTLLVGQMVQVHVVSKGDVP
jgi:multidrug efflux pump subunit AcrA (membrane-fusion protein)